jgi:hypothetical protein
MPEPNESAEPDPSDSMLQRARKKMDDSKLIELVVRWGMIAAVGAGSSVATRQVGDAEHNAVVNTNHAEILSLKTTIEELRSGFHQRCDVEEKEREEDIEKLRDRVMYLEARTGLRSDPPAPAASPSP